MTACAETDLGPCMLTCTAWWCEMRRWNLESCRGDERATSLRSDCFSDQFKTVVVVHRLANR